jgi:hypothetical protein
MARCCLGGWAQGVRNWLKQTSSSAHLLDQPAETCLALRGRHPGLDREAVALRAKLPKNALPAEPVRVSIRRLDAALIAPATFARMKTVRDSTESHLGRRADLVRR